LIGEIMGKMFYTERDIEDLAANGKRKIEVDGNVVLTDLAYDAAKRLNVEVIKLDDKSPSASSLSNNDQSKPYMQLDAVSIKSAEQIQMIKDRVKKSVLERLDHKVDDALIDKIIEKVLKYTPFSK